MGIWATLSAMVGGRYNYAPGPSTLGIGVENMALVQPGRAVDADLYSPRYNVRRDLSVGFPTVPNTGQRLPDYDLRADGVYLSGAVKLTPLVDTENLGGGE